MPQLPGGPGSALPCRALRAHCFRWTSFAPVAPRFWQRSDLADILQLGSPSGYEPLRRYLLEEARRQGAAGYGRRPADHQRLPAGARPDWPRPAAARRHGGGGRPGLHRFEEPAERNGRAAGGHSGGRRRHGRGATGARPGARAAALPGGDFRISRTRPAPRCRCRRAGRCWMRRARRGFRWWRTTPTASCATHGEPLPSLKQLDERGGTVLLRSFSKVSFPGLRVGWAVGPQAADRPAAAGQGVGRPAHAISFRRRCCWISPNRGGWKRTARAC